MNPYERRIIHSALQNDKFVETHSEGDEPFRKVVISVKKGVSLNSNNSNRFGEKDFGRKFNTISNNNTNKKDFQKKYGANTKDYSTDYKKDYAAYLEQKAAAKAAEAAKEES
jgi:spoIIIJ-associated protein